MKQLTELGRRVLSHLPDWAEDEEAFVRMEGGPENTIRSFTLPEMTLRVAEDIYTRVNDPQTGQPRPLNTTEMQLTLDALVAEELAYETGGRYYMTQLGFESLTGPEGKADQVPGKVVVDLAPGKISSDAIGVVSS